MDKNKTKGIENDIVYSQAVHAGNRIYYVDVKKTRAEEMYLTLTESKKVVRGSKTEGEVSFEKHKIFLYREDFTQFMETLRQAMDFIATHQGEVAPRNQEKTPVVEAPTTELGDEIKINIEF